MRSLIAWFSAFFFLVPVPQLFARTHLEQLKSRYPYGLLGDDYGLLSADDLAINTCDVDVTPFSKEKNMAYSYWQCFPVKNTKIGCESMGIESPGTSEAGYLEINAQNSSGRHSYLARNAIKIKDCQKRVRIWNKMVKGEKYVCLSGSFATSENTADGTTKTGWVLDKFKTQTGCESFGLDCDPKKRSNKKCIMPMRRK